MRVRAKDRFLQPIPIHERCLVFLGEILQAGVDALDGCGNAVATRGVGHYRYDGWGRPRVKQNRHHDGHSSRSHCSERGLDIGKRLAHVSSNLGGRPKAIVNVEIGRGDVGVEVVAADFQHRGENSVRSGLALQTGGLPFAEQRRRGRAGERPIVFITGVAR
jgi:hypothetical protein